MSESGVLLPSVAASAAFFELCLVTGVHSCRVWNKDKSINLPAPGLGIYLCEEFHRNIDIKDFVLLISHWANKLV